MIIEIKVPALSESVAEATLLSWHKKIKHPAEFTKVDASLDVIVLDIDQNNRKISLGHKQTEENPWDKHPSTICVKHGPQRQKKRACIRYVQKNWRSGPNIWRPRSELCKC